MTKLSVKQIQDIWYASTKNGGPYSVKELADMTGVTTRTVRYIVNNRGAYTPERIYARREREIQKWKENLR